MHHFLWDTLYREVCSLGRLCKGKKQQHNDVIKENDYTGILQTDTLILVAVDQLSYQFNTNKLSEEHYTLCKSSWARVQ